MPIISIPAAEKRNIVEYDYTGGATDKDADELIAFTRELLDDLIHWL